MWEGVKSSDAVLRPVAPQPWRGLRGDEIAAGGFVPLHGALRADDPVWPHVS